MKGSARKRRERKFRVWLNEEEVTSRCFYFNTRTGVVRLYKLDDKGHKHAIFPPKGSPFVAAEERHGKVQLQRIPR